MLDFIANLQPVYLYPVLFFGHIFLGGLILIPAIYLSTAQKISFLPLFIIIVTSSMVADSFWYFIGSNIKKEKVYSFSFMKKYLEEAKRFSTFYDMYGVWTVFLTKFIFGTRIASHILAGMHKIGLIKFLGATGAGTSLWFTIMYVLIIWLDKSVASAGAAAFHIQIVFLIIAVGLLLLNWFTSKYVKNWLLKSRRKR